MKAKFTFSVLVISVVAAIAFSVEWTQQHRKVHQLVIATGTSDGEYYAQDRI